MNEHKHEIVEESYVDIIVRFRVGRTDLTSAEGMKLAQVAQQIAQQMPYRRALILVGRLGAPVDKAGFFEIETIQAFPALWPANKYTIHNDRGDSE